MRSQVLLVKAYAKLARDTPHLQATHNQGTQENTCLELLSVVVKLMQATEKLIVGRQQAPGSMQVLANTVVVYLGRVVIDVVTILETRDCAGDGLGGQVGSSGAEQLQAASSD